MSVVMPRGLFDPVWCRKRMWRADAAAITIGRRK
jgi:hypothetical protein